VHQGIRDLDAAKAGDLGHERYMTIQDLMRIRKNEVSDNNPLWKKRDLLRRLSNDVYEILIAE
jgi:hypothetical protein